MNKIDVNGGWLVLRDAKQITERQRRPLMTLSMKAVSAYNGGGTEMSPDVMAVWSEFNDALALAVIAEWSFGEVTEDVLLDLPSATYDAVREIVSPLLSEVIPSFEPSPDPKVTTDS